MNAEQIHPELRHIMGRIPALPVHHRLGLSLVRLLLKMAPAQKAVKGVTLENKTLGLAKVRIYRPETAATGAGLLWIHGGGFIMGSVDMNDHDCSTYAKALGLVVVSVEYRLAPKHPFPAALDDCFEAWKGFQSAANEYGVDPAKIAVAGQSAGGGLAASLVQRIHDSGGTQPAAQVLIYPMLDDRTATRRELDPLNHRVWNNKNNLGGWSWYLGHAPGELNTAPYAVSARRENLSGLPTTWMGVGDIDLFHDEDCHYADRLIKDGVDCHLHVVPMAPHAFDATVPKSSVSREFNKQIHQFLRTTLAL